MERDFRWAVLFVTAVVQHGRSGEHGFDLDPAGRELSNLPDGGSVGAVNAMHGISVAQSQTWNDRGCGASTLEVFARVTYVRGLIPGEPLSVKICM